MAIYEPQCDYRALRVVHFHRGPDRMHNNAKPIWYPASEIGCVEVPYSGPTLTELLGRVPENWLLQKVNGRWYLNDPNLTVQGGDDNLYQLLEQAFGHG